MKRARRAAAALAVALGMSGAFAAQSSAIVWHPNEPTFAETEGPGGGTIRSCDGDAGDGHRVRAWIRWGTIEYASPWWAGPAGGCTGFWNPPNSIGAYRVCVEDEGCSGWVSNAPFARAALRD